MNKSKIADIDLQLFAQGAAGADAPDTGAGGEGGTVESTAADDGLQRLRELGVPEGKLTKRAQKQGGSKGDKARRGPMHTPKGRDAAGGAGEPQKDTPDNTSTRMTWDEIVADPEYNSRIQQIVRKRLAQAKAGQPAQGGDAAGARPNIPVRAMPQAAGPQMTGPNPAEAAMQRHFLGLRAQEQTLRRSMPGFDLAAELKNPAFARLVAPGSPIGLEEAYYALHPEARSKAADKAAQAAVMQLTNRIRAGESRPAENGGLPQAASLSRVDVKDKAYRESLKRQIRNAAADGRKLYPGGTKPGR